jgi:hypothetical protein
LWIEEGSTMQMSVALGEMLEPVITPDVARRLVALQADQKLKERVLVLGEKANEGALTSAERAEYEAYIKANDIVAILQAKARQVLLQQAS